MTNTWIDSKPAEKVAAVIENQGEWLKERYHTDDVHFAIWMHALNTVVRRRALVHFDDLEDWDYASAYEGDMNPRDAALEMLEDNGWGDALEEM